MSSNPPSALSAKSSTSSKAPSISNQGSPAHSQASAFFATEGLNQRRSGGSSSFGAVASSRSSPAPRKDQGSKNKHKQSRKAQLRLADEDAFAESAAMHSVNSRKGQTSITHLMQFALPPRPQYQPQRYGGGRSSRNTRTWGLGSGYHAVDKARYVHANYRFIVDPRADYRAQSVDADVHLDWNNVLQILASTQSQSAACPICLGTPVAPRMAKCGHIFCLPCLIRYMHSEDAEKPAEKKARWKKCPICWDSIYISETRPVRWYTGQEGEPPREGADVVLRLLKRDAGSTLAMPREDTDTLAKGEDVPWYHAAEVMDYARVMKGGEDYMLEQFEYDIATVKALEQEDELMFGEDTEWTGRAVRLLQESKEKVKGIGNPPAMPKKPDEKPKKPPIEFNDTEDDVPDMYTVQQAALSGQSISATPDPTSTNPTESSTPGINSQMSNQGPNSGVLSTSLADFRARQHASSHVQPDSYLFYQALLHYYLSPLDIRILKSAFGSYNSFPSSILPRVERVSTGHIVDDDLRKRVKYLSHLPYGCEVGFLECDWTDTVAPEVLARFAPDIERRRKRNMDKEMREEKERVQAMKAEEREFNAARRKRISISQENGAFSKDDFTPLVSTEVAESAASVDGSPPFGSGSQRAGFGSLASPGTSPNTMRTVWGTTAIAPSDEEFPLPQGPVDDGWLQGWEKDLVGDDELIAQVQAASLGEGSASASASVSGSRTPQSGIGGAGGGGGKGKKKGKKITLMSTTARRGA